LDYPAFTKFETPEILTVQSLVKLSCAIDRWSGSIAVYARKKEIVAWGVLDQLVQQNVAFHREPTEGYFANPGLLTVTMDGIGDISAYHGDMFLGGLKAQALITRENDALGSNFVSDYAFDAFAPFAEAIGRVLEEDETECLASLELSPKVGDGGNRKGGISWGCLTPPLLHRRSDMPCPKITSSS